MTNDRARQLAAKILDRAWQYCSAHYKISEAEPLILAYRDEVRREVLEEVAKRLRGGHSWARNSIEAYVMYAASCIVLNMVPDAPPPERQPPDIDPTPERLQNVGRILRQRRAENAGRADRDRRLATLDEMIDAFAPTRTPEPATLRYWMGAALHMLINHVPAISERDHAFVAEVKREWPDADRG